MDIYIYCQSIFWYNRVVSSYLIVIHGNSYVFTHLRVCYVSNRLFIIANCSNKCINRLSLVGSNCINPLFLTFYKHQFIIRFETTCSVWFD